MIRSSGILMHITSLPNSFGIGTLGKCAYDYADFLKNAGQKLWQMLPVGPTGYGDSPYQSFSSYAGNPYFIDLDILQKQGLLTKNDYAALAWGDGERTDYALLYQNREKVLRKAFANGIRRDFDALYIWAKSQHWLEDYALFMALKVYFDNAPWTAWPDTQVKTRDPERLAHYRTILDKDILFYKYVQFLFYQQWAKFKQYVNDAGIRIVGDIPIYVALDSADVWSCPQEFELDQEGLPLNVAGCPPDYFSATGQLWGNPLYRWEKMQADDFSWWIKRIKGSLNMFDILRIDHFRAFDTYYAIPYGDKTAEKGEWRQGVGIALFDAIRAQLGDVSIIAEDLGDLFPSVHVLLNKTGLPGMKVLEFAFDSGESNSYLPHSFEKNCVVYTGTHDNDTVRGWMRTAPDYDVDKAKRYMSLSEEEGYAWGFIRAAFSSVADVAVAQMQDFLDLDSDARMNTPSTFGQNWCWRMSPDALTDALAKKIHDMTKLYER